MSGVWMKKSCSPPAVGKPGREMKIGVLALQGDFEAHLKMLMRCEVEAIAVRQAAEITEIDGLIVPGGESTAIGKLADLFELTEPIRNRVQNGMPLFGTCAGLIWMAREIEGSDQPLLGLLDVTVARNAFGRQVDSFEADIPMPLLGDRPLRAVFIRAPYVLQAGEGVQVLARYEDKIVCVQEGNLLGAAFHPELTSDERLHRHFLGMVEITMKGKAPHHLGYKAR